MKFTTDNYLFFMGTTSYLLYQVTNTFYSFSLFFMLNILVLINDNAQLNCSLSLIIIYIFAFKF